MSNVSPFEVNELVSARAWCEKYGLTTWYYDNRLAELGYTITGVKIVVEENPVSVDSEEYME